MRRLAARLLTKIFRRRPHTIRRACPARGSPKLQLQALESRDAVGNLLGGLVAAAFGDHLSDPINLMVLALGEDAYLAGAMPNGAPSSGASGWLSALPPEREEPAPLPATAADPRDGGAASFPLFTHGADPGGVAFGLPPMTFGEDLGFVGAGVPAAAPDVPAPQPPGPGGGAGGPTVGAAHSAGGPSPPAPVAEPAPLTGDSSGVSTNSSGASPNPGGPPPTAAVPPRASPTADGQGLTLHGSVPPLPAPSPAPDQGGGFTVPAPPLAPTGAVALRAAATGELVTLEAPGYSLREARAQEAPPGAVPGFRFPYGLFSFQVAGVAVGGHAAVRLTLPAGARPEAYFKHDPATGALGRFDFDGTTGAQITGNVVTLHLVDGGRGDADGLANGVIMDPGGPGAATDIPGTQPPVFNSNPYVFDVPAGTGYESVVGTVTAVDPDGNPVTYGSDSAWPLAIDPATGTLSVYATGALAEGAGYTFSVWADDGQERGWTTVIVNVGAPVNDPPTFIAPGYAFTVAESATYGTFVGTVQATDPVSDTSHDSAQAAAATGDALSYWADWSWPFGIDAETGAVYVYYTGDLQVGQVYEFTAWVSDQSGFDSVPVTIAVVEGGGLAGPSGSSGSSPSGGSSPSPLGGGGDPSSGGGVFSGPGGGTPSLGGNSEVFEGSVYTLLLNANGAAVLNWNVDWGDGQVQQYSGTTTQATHVYADGDQSYVIKVIAVIQNGTAGPFEGLSPGYWKQPQHANEWHTYRPSDNYEAIFGVSNPQKPPKLIDALRANGGGIKALWRQSTAALLNAAHPYINYRYTIPQIISMVQQAYATGDYETPKNLFEVENNLGADLTPDNGGGQVAIPLDYPLFVRNVPPTLVLSGAPTASLGQTYTLNLSSSDPGQDTITSWRIDWGDGQVQTVNNNPPSVTHVYQSVGVFTISATATDEDGTWDSNHLPVTVGANTLSGFVYHDADNDGVKDPGEAGLFGAAVALTGTDFQGVAVNRSAVTDFAGAYRFDNLKAGTYTVTETQPTGWTDGLDTVGTPSLGATVQANDRLGIFTFPTGVTTASVNNNFGERQVSISGWVFADANWNGVQDTAPPNPEVGIGGVTVTLKNAAGVTIDTRTTQADGSYNFGPRAPALYTVVETQPNGYGSSTPDVVSINLAVVGQNIVNFGDTPCGLASWDTGEDGGSTGGKGTATDSGGHLLLREGDSFLVWARKQFVVPNRPGVLRLTYADLFFDSDSTGTIRDAFEAAIVDPATGATLVLPYAAKRQAGFNVTEGLPVVTGQGTVETGGVVSFDLSGLAPGTVAELVVRLVNNDDACHNDEDTHVLVHCVDVEADEAAKFFVVDDAVDSTFRYDPAGGPMGNSALLGANGAPASPRGTAASGDGSRVWVVDATRTVWVYDGSGTPVGAWQATDAALTDPQGVTTNGTDIWLVDAATKRVYRYAYAAALTVGTAAAISSFALHSDNARPSDLVTDGTTIWVTDEGTDEVFVYSLTGTLQGRWKLDTRNTNASGITLNPAGGTDLWVVDRQDLMVYHYATGRTQTSGSLSATDTLALSAGEGRPEGIADPPISSTTTDLWLAFPYAWNTITNPEDEQYQTHKYRLYITGAIPTTGTVSVPGYFAEAFSVTPGQVTTVAVPASAGLGYTPDATFADKGVHVTSGAPVSVVGMDRWRFTTDSYLALPTAGMGTEYLLPSFRPIDRATWGSQFAVLAVENDTEVTITPTVPRGGNPPGTPFTITLQQGDVYQLADLTRDYDVTGSLIKSNKPVAVYGTNRGTNIPEYSLGAADYIIEQVPPISAWGTHYLELPHKSPESLFADPNRTSTYRILASADNTQVQVTFYPPSGTPTTDTYTINRGQFVQLHAYNNLPERDPRYPLEIVADKPVLVAHFADSTFAPTEVTNNGEIVADIINGPGDPFMSILPAVSQYTNSYAVPIPAYSGDLHSEGQRDNFLNVIVATADAGGLRLNGRPVTDTGRSSGANTPTTLNDTIKNWAPDQWQHQVVKITAGTGAGQVRTIASNTATQLTVTTDWTTVPDNTSEYVISEIAPIGATGYSGVQLWVPAGTLQFLTTTNGQPFGVMSYGFSDFDSYGHVGGTLLQSVGPAITIESPPEGSEFPSNQTVLVTGRATTSTPSAPIVSVTVDGQEVEALDPAGHFFTRVTVQPGRNSFEFQATDSLGRIATTFLTLTGREAISPTEGLLDIAGFRAEYGRTSFDEATDVLYADLAIRNVGVFPLRTPLILTVEDISDPQVVLRDFDGRLADGTPYYDLSSLVDDGTLSPGEITGIKTLAFRNPGKRQFHYTLALRANVNHAPGFGSVPNLEVVAGKSYRYTAEAADPDGDTVTYTLAAGPDGMTVVLTSGQVSYNPPGVDSVVGRYSVIIQANDGKGGSVLQRYELTVLPTSAERAPIFFTPPPITANVGTQYVYQPAVRDPDGDTPTVTLTGGPPGAIFTNGQLLWTPLPDQVGERTLTLTATDGTLSTNQTFTARVSPVVGNHSPIIYSTALTAVRVSTGYAYQVRAWDEDRDTLGYAVSSPALANLQVDASGLVTWTAPGTAGSGDVTVTVTDGKGGTATQTFPLNILNVTPATVSGVVFDDLNGDGVQQAGEAGEIGWTVFVDRDGSGRRDPGEWSAVTDAAGAYTIGVVLPGSYTLRAERLFDKGFTLPAGGQRSITVSAGQALSGQTFGTKDQINRDPTMGGTPPSTGSVGSLYTFTPTFGDLDGDALRFDAPVNPGGLFIHPITGAVSWTPTADELGDNPVLVRAQDGQGGVALLPFSVHVSPANHRPFIASLAQQGPVELGMTYRYQIAALDPDPNDTLTYTKLNPTPDGVQVDQNTGVVTWDPQASGTAEGFYTISLEVRDAAGLTAVQNYELEVGSSFYTDRSPVIITHPRTVTGVGQTYLYPVRGVDPDGNPVTFSLVDPLPGMQLDANNILSWTPTAPGDYTVKVKVSDGKFHITQGNPDNEYKHTQVFTLTVLPEAPDNRRPVVLSVPPKYADIGSVFAYNVLAGDLDDDFMRYTLRGSVPDGVVLDSATGALRWRPAAWQGGNQTITVRAIDRFGAFVDHTFRVLVRDGNRPPLITSSAPAEGEVLQPYFYPIRVEDPDGDAVTLSWSGSIPPGLQLVNSQIKGTPTTAGTYIFTIHAEDARGAFSEQPVRLVISPVLNWPPIIGSDPVLNTVTGASYAYQISATDPDVGDTLSYSVTTSPSVSMTANGTGLVSWAVPSNYVPAGQTATVQVTVRVTDNGTPSRFAEQKYPLTVRGNRSPSLAAVGAQSVTAGNPWRLDLAGSDPDPVDTLTYALTGRNGTVVPPDLTVNGLGQVRWVNTLVGTYDFTATVKDPYNLSASRDFTLTVLPDTEAPSVALEVQDDPGQLNAANRFKVDASDNVGVVERKLEVSADNGQTWQVIGLDNDGVGHWTPTATNVFVYKLRARAKDAAGLTGEFMRDLDVFDPTATGAPVVTITVPAANGEVTAPTAVTGTITDNGTLLRWTLDYRPIDGSTDWKVIKEVTGGLGSSVNVNETFDPTLLANGAYTLRLRGTDTGGNVGTAFRTIQVDGNLKLGNFKLEFTDLTVPVAGIPITIGRVYDTLDANKKLDFGYGWRLTLGGYSATVDQSTTDLPFLNSYPTFKDGTRVYVRRPDGGIDGYTFTPTPAETLFNSVLSWYPAFTPDDTASNNLKVDQVPLIKDESSGEYLDYEFGGYNPANPVFGGAYDVVDTSKLKYEIDGDSGEQISVRDRNENKLTLEEDGVVSTAGRQVTFERDAEGRIIALEDPRHNKVRYRYDAKGNLVEVTDRLSNPPTQFTYRTDRPHYLNEVIDPFGRTGIKTDVYADGRLKSVTDAQGQKAQYAFDVATRTETITDQNQHTVTVKADVRGNVTETVNQEGVTTQSTYKPGTPFPESQTQVIGAPGGGDDLTTTFTSDAQGRPLTETDPLGGEIRITYNDRDLPETITDPSGVTTTLRYDPKDNVELLATAGAPTSNFTYFSNGSRKTSTVNGATNSFEYNGYGDQTAVVNPSNVRQESDFDANGNRIATRDTFTVNGATVVVSETITYDEDDRPIATARIKTTNSVPQTLWTTTKHYNALGQVDRETDQNGTLIEHTYDTRGRVIETRRRVKDETGANVWLTTRKVYDAAGRETYATDPFIVGSGRPITGTHTTYDDAGQPTRTEMLEGLTINIVGTGNNLRSELASAGTVQSFTTTEYDSAGREIRTVDKYGREMQTTYDRFGRKTQTRTESANADGSPAWLITRTVYDRFGRATAVTDPYVEGSAAPVYVTRTIYDEFGRKVQTQRRQGAVVALDLATGNTTLTSAGTVISTSRTVFDSTGRTVLTVSATGEVTRFEYDSLGRRSAVISHAVLEGSTWVSQRTETGYDEHDRQNVVRTNIRVIWSADPNSADSTATYTIDRSQQQETHNDYDAFGSVTKSTFQDGHFVAATYDDLGRRTSVTDELSQTTNYEYDSRSRLSAVVQAAVINPATGLSEAPRTEYKYDAYGNLVQIQDANDHVTKYGYDEQNRQSSRTLPSVTGEPAAVESMTYNALGNVDFTIDFKGQKADYVYDYELTGDTRLGLLRRVDYFAAGSPTPSETVAYTYDAFGRTDVVTETVGGVSRVTDTDYDGEGRVTRILNADGEIHYAYNLIGEKVQMWTGSATTFAGGATGVEYGYDAFGRLDLVREVRRDGAALTDPVETRSTFDFAGKLATEAVAQGSTSLRYTSYQYDPARGWLMDVTNRASAGGALLSDFTYTRRADGHIATVSETVKQPDGSSVTTSNSYTYDADNRLKQEVVNTSATGGDYTTDYTLDLVGNRVKKVTTNEGGAVQRTEGTFDARDRLTQELVYNTASGGTPVDTVTYQYDTNGSLTRRQTTSGSKLEQTWDLRNRLAGATISQLQSGVWVVQTTADYKYTADGIRSRVTENGTATKYTIDPMSPSGYAEVVEERTAAGALLASYVYGTGLAPLSTFRSGSGAGVYLSDGHSGVRQVAAAAAAILAAYRYDAFGNKVANVGTFVNPIGYRGERFDPTLGQYSLRARFYDPRTGRFTKMDPLPGNPSMPHTLNRYAFVHGDPLNFADPSGLTDTVEVNVTMGMKASFFATLGVAIIPKLPLIIGWIFYGPPDALAYGAFFSYTFGSGTLSGGPIFPGGELVFEPREKKILVYVWAGVEVLPNGPHVAPTPTNWWNAVTGQLQSNAHVEFGAFEAWEWGTSNQKASWFVLPLGITVNDRVYGGFEFTSDGVTIFLSGVTVTLYEREHGGPAVNVFGMAGRQWEVWEHEVSQEFATGLATTMAGGFSALFAYRALPLGARNGWGAGAGAVLGAGLTAAWITSIWGKK
jgi:RHS repeat-associated protein